MRPAGPPRNRLLSVLIASTLVMPSSAAPQAPAPATPPAPTSPAPSPYGEWLGTWSGSARLTNEGEMGPCPYVGAAKPPAVTLDLTQEGEALKGTMRLNFPALTIPGCPAIEKVVEAREISPAGSSLALAGPGEHTWNLGRRGKELLGTVAWKGTSPGADGLRLSGEVKLTLSGARGGGPAKKTGAMGAVGGILLANVVGIGAFAAANKLGKGDTSAPPQVNCSPRQCFFIGPGECECNTLNTAGGTCGTTTSGVGYAGVCNVDGGLPCQASLSCNIGNPSLCEDRFGRCPF